MAGLPPHDPDEPQSTRLARNFSELLQELRVQQAGVQILFAFLLAIVFTEVYQEQSDYVRTLHLATVLCAAMSSALLIARRCGIGSCSGTVGARHPASGQPLRAGRLGLPGRDHGRHRADRRGGRGRCWVAKLIGACTALVFGTLWFAVPALLRRDDELR